MAIKKVTIGIDEDVLKVIDQRAKDSTRSRSNYITSALKNYAEYEIQKENTERELRNRIIELEKQLVKIVPTDNKIKEDHKDNDDFIEPIKIPNF